MDMNLKLMSQMYILDTCSFEYEVKIKDENNILREVTVDTNLGVITEIDNYFD